MGSKGWKAAVEDLGQLEGGKDAEVAEKLAEARFRLAEQALIQAAQSLPRSSSGDSKSGSESGSESPSGPATPVQEESPAAAKLAADTAAKLGAASGSNTSHAEVTIGNGHSSSEEAPVTFGPHLLIAEQAGAAAEEDACPGEQQDGHVSGHDAADSSSRCAEQQEEGGVSEGATSELDFADAAGTGDGLSSSRRSSSTTSADFTDACDVFEGPAGLDRACRSIAQTLQQLPAAAGGQGSGRACSGHPEARMGASHETLEPGDAELLQTLGLDDGDEQDCASMRELVRGFGQSLQAVGREQPGTSWDLPRSLQHDSQAAALAGSDDEEPDSGSAGCEPAPQRSKPLHAAGTEQAGHEKEAVFAKILAKLGVCRPGPCQSPAEPPGGRQYDVQPPAPSGSKVLHGVSAAGSQCAGNSAASAQLPPPQAKLPAFGEGLRSSLAGSKGLGMASPRRDRAPAEKVHPLR